MLLVTEMEKMRETLKWMMYEALPSLRELAQLIMIVYIALMVVAILAAGR